MNLCSYTMLTHSIHQHSLHSHLVRGGTEWSPQRPWGICWLDRPKRTGLKCEIVSAFVSAYTPHHLINSTSSCKVHGIRPMWVRAQCSLLICQTIQWFKKLKERPITKTPGGQHGFACSRLPKAVRQAIKHVYTHALPSSGNTQMLIQDYCTVNKMSLWYSHLFFILIQCVFLLLFVFCGLSPVDHIAVSIFSSWS